VGRVEENKDMTDSERLIQALKAFHISMFMLVSVVSEHISDEEMVSLRSISTKMIEETLKSIHRSENIEEASRLNRDFLDFLEEVFQETVGISAEDYLNAKKNFNDGNFN
jgi:hypothetical protein